jgi:hypothetical protein
MKFVQPRENLDAFTCPYCGVLAQQFSRRVTIGSISTQSRFEEISVRQCGNCNRYIVWWKDVLTVPQYGGFELPNPDLPEDIRRDYDEAASIADRSPRGATALLRLCVQKLCRHLGYQHEKIDDAIGAMVSDGLPVKIQQALDAVRVIGNNAVHPGVINLTDDVELAGELASLLNIIADNRISEPKRINEIYEKLPATARAAIETRNAKALSKPASSRADSS